MIFYRIIQTAIVVSGLALFSCNDIEKKSSLQHGSAEAAVADTLIYKGIDVSHYQGDIDWHSVKKDSIYFAFAKATEGSQWVDSTFSKNWENMEKAGIARGAYHFFHPDVSAQKQAAHFIETVRKLQPGDLSPMLDIEAVDGKPVESLDDSILVWLNIVQQEYKVKPIIYANKYFFNKYLSKEEFSAFPLWIADYKKTPPKAFKWTFWQYSKRSSIIGIDNLVDRNVFKGGETKWKELLYQ